MPNFIVFVQASKESEEGQVSIDTWDPFPHCFKVNLILTLNLQQTATKEQFAEMHAFNKIYRDSGALIDANGLLPSSTGARVSYSEESEPVVKCGPFELENLVAGYWVLKLDSIEEAIEFAKKVPFKGGSVQIRKIAGPDECGNGKEKDN